MNDQAPDDFVDLVTCLHDEVAETGSGRRISRQREPSTKSGFRHRARRDDSYKRAAGRTKDLAEAETLEEIRARRG
jgi:hypothetical protein